MKKIFQNYLFSPVLSVLFIGIFLALNIGRTADDIFRFDQTVLEITTFSCYALSLIAMIWFSSQLQKSDRPTFILLIALWFCALFRELGIQHWLTTTDSTAFKIRFFTNSNNPLSEKILAGLILLGVFAIVTYLLIKYAKKIMGGFFKLDPLYWTICSFGAAGVVCKIADRIPGNIRKMNGGISMDPTIHAYMEIIEESSEALLPLLFAVALIQYILTKSPAQTTLRTASKPTRKR